MSRRTLAIVLLGLVPVSAAGQPATPDAETLFETKVRPVLVEHCLRCHGGDKVSHGLRVDSRAALLRGGDNGPALVPGDPDRSLLVRAIRHADIDGPKMPPGNKLPPAVVADLAAWVKQGAVWPDRGTVTAAAAPHWAFQPPRRVEPPPDPTGWAANPVDHFVLARLRAQGLRPVADADRRTLLRRLTFDLTRLPPTPEEVNAFLTDDSPAAYARVVDRLLASPAYGERWGRHWMDVARYADTAGDNADYPIPEARLYRDYLIDAWNADQPYDQFVREQLAGDLLARDATPDEYRERVIATGFLALSRRYATAPYELWHLTLEDTIDTVGQAILGLTLRCARCHDHKFDPPTSQDYYALYGIFASTQFPWAGGEEFASKGFHRQHFVPLLPPAQAAPMLRSHTQRVQEQKDEIARLEKRDPKSAELGKLKTEQARLLRGGLPPDLPGAYAVQEGKPVDVPVQRRGDPADPGAVVRRAAPRFLTGGGHLAIPPGQSGRLQLAEWLTRPDHPLTARVLVNRLWQHHFGKGLVGTPNNFGRRGEPPTHPELLDYLATTLVDNGWSVKAVHRLIVSSKTYQLAGTHEAAAAAADPGNRWYGRFDRRRLDAEALRDALLAVSGTLDRRRPGPHPFPPVHTWGWTQHHPFKEVYPSAHRSVYLMTQRLQRHPFLALFDGPDPNTTTEKRPTSTVPLQALYWMNSPQVKAAAEAFAGRLWALAADTGGRIRGAHELAYGRPPTAAEEERGRAYLDAYQAELRRAGVAEPAAEAEAWTSYARVLLTANEFVYLD